MRVDFDKTACDYGRHRTDAWRGRIRASAGVAASLPAHAVTKFDAELAALLASKYPDDPLPVPHRVWAMTAQSPGPPEALEAADKQHLPPRGFHYGALPFAVQ